MATRKKTVRFAADTYTTLVPDAVLTPIASFTIYIPETTRTIVSAFAVVSFMDVISATGGTINEWRVALALGGAGANTITDLNDIANTGENLSVNLGPLDYTAYFVSNFGAGTSQTCAVSLYVDQNTGTTLGVQNSTVEVFVTYTYDDTAATQIKTVVIPLESPAASLGTTTGQIGTNQVPILTGASGILPEANVTIRDYYFLIEGNEHGGTGTADITLNVSLDGGSPTKAFGLIERALASCRFDAFIWDLSSAIPTTTTTHAFNAWSAGLASFNHLVIKLVITYEFTIAGTTRILNSIQVPIEAPTPTGNTAATDNTRITRDVYIEEPGTITMVQSGYQLCWNEAATVTGLRTRVGAQAYRAYTSNTSVMAGMITLQQRIDSGSAQGSAGSIGRGLNTFVVDIYGTSATAYGSNISGLGMLNYISDVPSGGPGAANHTLYEFQSQYTSLAQTVRSMTGYVLTIPEANHWLTSSGFWFIASLAGVGGMVLVAQKGSGLGWETLYSDVVVTDGEYGNYYTYVQTGDVFKRHGGDPAPGRIDPEVSTRLIVTYSGATRFGVVRVYTYHAISYQVTGQVTGYTGDGSGITLYLTRDAQGDVRATGTTTTGGDFTITWFDDAEPIHVCAAQADRAGRSLSSAVGA